jgi:hypothetical protein
MGISPTYINAVKTDGSVFAERRRFIFLVGRRADRRIRRDAQGMAAYTVAE